MAANMETLHRESGTSLIQNEGQWVVRRYGDPHTEHAAIRGSCGLIDLSDWNVVRLEGPERASFLHRMVTNDVINLQPGQGNYNLILTPKGKIISDLWLLARENVLLLISRGGQGQTIAETLDKYLFMEETTITSDSPNWGMAALQGPLSMETLRKAVDGPLPEQEYAWTPIRAAGEEILAIRLTITGEEGVLLLGAPSALPSLWRLLTEHGAKPVGLEALEIVRIEAGIPVFGKELSEEIIPQEACLHHAISFTKGCYTGQETVARLHFRGHVNRELTGFFLERPEAPSGEIQLIEGEKQVGAVTSACYSYSREALIGLGYLRVKLKETDREIEARSGEERFTARVAELPFARA